MAVLYCEQNEFNRKEEIECATDKDYQQSLCPKCRKPNRRDYFMYYFSVFETYQRNTLFGILVKINRTINILIDCIQYFFTIIFYRSFLWSKMRVCCSLNFMTFHYKKVYNNELTVMKFELRNTSNNIMLLVWSQPFMT